MDREQIEKWRDDPELPISAQEDICDTALSLMGEVAELRETLQGIAVPVGDWVDARWADGVPVPARVLSGVHAARAALAATGEPV